LFVEKQADSPANTNRLIVGADIIRPFSYRLHCFKKFFPKYLTNENIYVIIILEP